MNKNLERQSESKVYESAEELYHDAPCGYISFSNNGIIYNLNRTLLEWLGYERKEIVGKIRIQDLFKMGGKIFFETHFFPLIRIQGFANEINFDIRKKDKSTFPALINVKEIKDPSVNGYRYRATIFDITDRKKYEQELINSKLKAEKATKAKADFLATISHEIRTPLNAILGIGNLIAKTPLNEKQKEYCDILKMSSENLLNLINNLLDLSKMEAQQVTLEKKSFAVRTLIKSLISTFEVKCKEKDVLLFAEIAEEIPDYIIGDPIKLNQILTNLIGNAVKFTCDGHIKLVVDLHSIDSENLKLDFKVIDTGIGIPKDKLNTIFNEFSQASYNANLEHGGTGLGLSISQKLLQLHHSEIAVKSELGKGSEFVFQIEYEVYDSANPKAKLIFDSLDIEVLDAARILVVEDNPVNTFVISEYLTDWKINFDTAENGQEAISAVKKETYDVILMDLNMPILNGFDASSAIRSLQLEKQPAILALSATSRENIEEQLNRARINDFISKPFGPDDLHKVLSHYIKTSDHIPQESGAETESAKLSNDEKSCKNLEAIFDLSRFVKMANNKPEFLKKFVINTAYSFEDYLDSFIAAVDKEDPEAISDLIHKSTMSVYYIQADSLVNLLRECQYCLENETVTSQKTKKVIEKTLQEFHKIINGLKKVNFDALIMK